MGQQLKHNNLLLRISHFGQKPKLIALDVEDRDNEPAGDFHTVGKSNREGKK